ncbi:MAG: hypothetical protein JJE39_01800 [Vicinamibacteria bacterium]|nr:hypothetical protein [Vicinamibacteria bacterium]
MTQRRSSQSIRCMILAVLLTGLPSAARAGRFPYWGLSFGTSERAAAHLGISFGHDIPSEAGEGFALGSGPVVEAAVGMGGASLGLGRSILILTEGKPLRVYADVKAVTTRTWDRPRSASPHATYLGVEGGLSISFMRFTMGVSKRLERKDSGANVLFTWGAGLQIRMGRRQAR